MRCNEVFRPLDYSGKKNIFQNTIWLFNIAMENPQNKWMFIAGKIIYKWAMDSMAMLNNQRVPLKYLGLRAMLHIPSGNQSLLENHPFKGC